MGEQKSELEDKVKAVVQEAAGDNELSDEALEQIAGGVMTDLAARFNKAGLFFPQVCRFQALKCLRRSRTKAARLHSANRA